MAQSIMSAGGVQQWWVELPAGPVILAFIVVAMVAGQVIGWCVLRATRRPDQRRRAHFSPTRADSGTWQKWN
ncbi:hypothetical protein [Gordonia sp. CPCC 205333]|uniref:hypothetical protein n=1 Tax=Gordonia sp. CPCC 205333 TaxID=3140790 RepID=UPI003AF38338